jgi:hypothetical protein
MLYEISEILTSIGKVLVSFVPFGNASAFAATVITKLKCAPSSNAKFVNVKIPCVLSFGFGDKAKLLAPSPLNVHVFE